VKITVQINQDSNTGISGEHTYSIPGKDSLTLLDLLQTIDAEHQGFCRSVLEDGNIRDTLIVLVNGDNVRYLDGLESRIGEQDEVYIIPAVAGG